MGMSASQARLINLTARMSDVEYEGQQINQQRLTLANQMNAIQAAMYEMEVPTPPSKIDYMHDVYSGKNGDDNVYVTKGKDGSFNLQTPVEGDTLAATANTYDVGTNTKYTPVNQNELPAAGGRQATAYYHDLVDNTVKNPTQEQLKALAGDGGSAGNLHLTSDAQISKDPKYKEEKYVDENGTTQTRKVQDGFENYRLTSGSVYEGSSQFTTDGEEKHVTTSGGGTLNATYTGHNDISITYYYKGVQEELSASAFEQKYTTGYTDYAITNMTNQYYKGDGEKLSADDFDSKTGKLKEGVTITKAEQEETIGGKKSYTIDDAKKEFGDDALSDIITRINNFAKGYDDSSDVDLSDWRIVKDGDKFSAVKLSSNGKKATGYANKTDTIYEETTIPNENVGFNAAGLSSVTDKNGNKINLTVSQEVDEIAYGIAMKEYEAEKAEYDREQNEFNKKTSIYQRQDKMLELKLTRLDNERNALNTEIEAVKKVIQDSIDRGFKTFSG